PDEDHQQSPTDAGGEKELPPQQPETPSAGTIEDPAAGWFLFGQSGPQPPDGGQEEPATEPLTPPEPWAAGPWGQQSGWVPPPPPPGAPAPSDMRPPRRRRALLAALLALSLFAGGIGLGWNLITRARSHSSATQTQTSPSTGQAAQAPNV